MVRCQPVRSRLTAWLDEELSARWDRKVREHLAQCAGCSAEAAEIRTAISFQMQALSQLLRRSGEISPSLWSRIDGRVEEADEPLRSTWSWMRRPIVVGVAVALSMLALASVAGGPETVLIPLGVKAPPAIVKQAPEMFTKFRMFEKLDILQNFDTVDAIQIDDGDAAKG